MAALLKSPGEPASRWKPIAAGESLPQATAFNLLGKRPKSDAIALIELGLPRSAFDRLQAALGLSQKQAAEAVMLPIRTLSRRQKLLAPESDRVFRLGMLFQRALEVMGDADSARRWLQTPKHALGGATPLRLARTSLGASRVETLLGQLEHGVFA